MQTNFIIKNKNPRIKSLGDNITSHHCMTTTFSGTDMDTLQKEGKDTNCFVSLIVNTEGSYSAKITRRVQTKSEVTIKSLGKSYEFFGDGAKEIAKNNSETTKVINKEVIEYFDMEVERHEAENEFKYLDDRFDEILSKKDTGKPWSDLFQRIRERSDNAVISSFPSEDSNGNRLFSHGLKDKFPYGFKDMSLEDGQNQNKAALDWQPDKKKIHNAVISIISCSMILNAEKFDLRQWIKKYMMKVYERIFGELNMGEVKGDASCAFNEWKDFIIGFVLDNYDYSDVPDSLMEEYDVIQGKVANAIMDELFEYTDGHNPYIDAYYDALSNYIV